MSHHLHRRDSDPPPLEKEPPPPITSEQLDFFTEQTERAAEKATARALRQAMKGYIILLCALLLGTGIYAHEDGKQRDADVRKSQQTLHDGLIGSCNRVNVLRAQSNLSDVVSWSILSTSGRRELKLARIDQPETRSAHRESAQALLEQAKTLTATGITDCAAAVSAPLKYKQPIASPIGDPYTGDYGVGIPEVLKDSREVLQVNATRIRGG